MALATASGSAGGPALAAVPSSGPSGSHPSDLLRFPRRPGVPGSPKPAQSPRPARSPGTPGPSEPAQSPRPARRPGAADSPGLAQSPGAGRSPRAPGSCSLARSPRVRPRPWRRRPTGPASWPASARPLASRPISCPPILERPFSARPVSVRALPARPVSARPPSVRPLSARRICSRRAAIVAETSSAGLCGSSAGAQGPEFQSPGPISPSGPGGSSRLMPALRRHPAWAHWPPCCPGRRWGRPASPGLRGARSACRAAARLRASP